MESMSGIIQWGGWIIGFLSGSIVIYKYLLKRPSLYLEIGAVGELDTENNIPLLLTVANDGRKFGEDVMIHMELEGMGFINLDREQDLNDTNPAEQILGNFANYNEIRTPLVGYLIANDEGEFTLDKARTNRAMFQIDDVIYSNIGIQFTSKLANFSEESATIEYEIACRSHEPRKGIIELYLNENKVIIDSVKPTFCTRTKRRLSNILYWA